MADPVAADLFNDKLIDFFYNLAFSICCQGPVKHFQYKNYVCSVCGMSNNTLIKKLNFFLPHVTKPYLA